MRTNLASLLSKEEEGFGVIPVPEEFNVQTMKRMAWIMNMAMDTLLPTLMPEQRKLIEGETDLRTLVVPLLQAWEDFRSTARSRTRKTAKSIYEKVKKDYLNNEHFERFWARKSVSEQDEASWSKFKTLVTGLLQQASMIDRILDGTMNNVTTRKFILIIDVLPWSSDFWGRHYLSESLYRVQMR
jgi:hypothetical protein